MFGTRDLTSADTAAVAGIKRANDAAKQADQAKRQVAAAKRSK